MIRIRTIAILAFGIATAGIAVGMGGGRKLKAPGHESILESDFAIFKNFDQPDLVNLEIYYRVRHAKLTFKKDSGHYSAEYEVRATVLDKKNRVVARDSHTRTVTVGSKERTHAKRDFRVSQFDFYLKPDRYWIKLSISDKLGDNSKEEGFEAHLKPFKSDRPYLSGLEFVFAVQATENETSLFRKGEFDVIPSVVRTYGGTDSSMLLYYQEIYQGEDTSQTILVETRLRHWSKGMIYRDTLYVTLDKPIDRQLRRISLDEFPAGAYQLEIYLRGRRNKELQVLKEPFQVIWTPEGRIRHDWKTVISQLEYIADADEVNPIKNVDSFAERKAAYDAFWEARDPSIGTPENEARDEFYRRINFANTYFRGLKREGWRSDRGRIYIRHGPPDEINDYQYEANARPYLIWHYFTRGEYLRFKFIDENQDGDYRLQYPYDGRGQRPDF